MTSINSLESYALRDQWINKISPLVKLIITILFTVLVISVPAENISMLVSFVLYPFFVFTISDLSIKECFHRLRVAIPFVLMLGFFNLFFDKSAVKIIYGFTLTRGFFTFISLLIKGTLCVISSYLLAATTTIDSLCSALRKIFVPRIIVTVIMLIYRYLGVLIRETERITTAYSLRAPKQKGIHISAWGSLAGILLLHSIDRAEVVYNSMILRGYNTEVDLTTSHKTTPVDILYLAIISIALISLRRYNLFNLVGNIFI